MASPPSRPPRTHVVIIDGTQSRLAAGEETNAGLLYKLLKEANPPSQMRMLYDEGIQGHGFWNWVTIASGWGINQSIEDAYGWLAAQYQPGDAIYLFGYSRGAYAVRSVAGMIDRIGLLRSQFATERMQRRAFRLYESQMARTARTTFSRAYCHQSVPIRMIGVWDTVKALGLPYPLLSYLAPMATEFHNHDIGLHVEHAYQALALDETRIAFRPEMWEVADDWRGHLEQVWFNGAHGDIGGHVVGVPAARALSNIPLIWLLARTERCGLALPQGWRDRFECDPNAPRVGSHRGIGKFFLLRRRRTLGRSPGEFLHATAAHRQHESRLPLPVQPDAP